MKVAGKRGGSGVMGPSWQVPGGVNLGGVVLAQGRLSSQARRSRVGTERRVILLLTNLADCRGGRDDNTTD